MIDRKLLAEAIADAKMVKQTAIENAKLSLTESFSPYLQSMFAAKIQEMESEDEETLPEVNELDELDELLKEIDMEDDLDEVKKEKDESEDKIEDEKTDEPNGEEDENIEDELNIEDMSEEDLKSFIEDVINDMIESGELEPGEETEEHEDAESESEETEEHESETPENFEELDEELGFEIEEDLSDPSAVDEIEENTSSDELDEMQNTLASLRQEMNEIKLLNAKLLYSNKIFKEKQLSEGKKLQVLHAFDKVTTIKEAKTTYDILKENLDSKNLVKSNVKSLASKSITPILESKKPILEVNSQYDRWQILAGIK